MKAWKAIGGAALALVAVLWAFNALVVAPQIAEVQTEGRGLVFPSEFQDVRVTGDAEFDKTIDVDGAATLNSSLAVGGGYGSTGCTLSAAGVLQCNGAATIDGAATVTGNATFSAFIVRSSASITPTDGGTLTPTAEIMTLTPAGALGTALGACTTGYSTILYNSVNANVVITDTGNFIGAGNATLGQYDALRLICIDSKWVQVSAVSAN